MSQQPGNVFALHLDPQCTFYLRPECLLVGKFYLTSEPYGNQRSQAQESTLE